MRASVHVAHPAVRRDAHLSSGVAHFPGAETGTGSRIRDVQATGTGANVTASTVGYWVGVLTIPRLRAAVGGDSEWARAADHRDRRLEQ